MTALADFLEARLAEDEAAAHAAVDPRRPGTHWHWVNDETDEPIGNLDAETAIGGLSLRTVEQFVRGTPIGPYVPSPLPAFVIYTAEEVIPGAGDHIARHDPARVLREVEAKRAIIDTILPCPTCLEGARCVPHDSSVGAPMWRTATERDEHALKLLAAVYSDHPDYNPDWSTT